MLKYILVVLPLIATCSNANFGGPGNTSQPSPQGANANPQTTSTTTSTQVIPIPTTTLPPIVPPFDPLQSDNGSVTATAVNSVRISLNAGFDGVTTLTLDLATGGIGYQNMGKYALPSIEFTIVAKNGAESPLRVVQGQTASIPNWRPAKGATPRGFEIFRSTDSKRKQSSPPSVTSVVIGTVLTIKIDDDLGDRPGAVSFPNFDLGLSY